MTGVSGKFYLRIMFIKTNREVLYVKDQKNNQKRTFTKNIMTYNEFINNILETRGRFNCENEHHERHHIIPKCVGGTNDKDNLIDLFLREHFEAHRLLALENQDNEKLVCAWWVMSHDRKGRNITAEEYEEARIAIKQSISGEKHPMYGKHPSDSARQKMSDSRKGKRLSEETKQKISDSHKGKHEGENNSMYGRRGADCPNYGKHHSEEARKKMSEARMGKYKGENSPTYGKHPSDETKRKIGEANRGRYVGTNSCRARKVAQYDLDGNLIRIWDYIKQAANTLGLGGAHISACCRGKKGRKTVGGFVWRYVDETPQNDCKITKETEEVDRDVN